MTKESTVNMISRNMQAQLGLAQAEIKAAEANSCRPLFSCFPRPCIISRRSPTPTNALCHGSLCRGRPVLQQQAPSTSHIIHHPCSSTGLMLINPSSIRLTSSGSTSLDGCERIQWSTSYILSQARLVQVRIRCLLYVNFRAMYSLRSKKMQLSLPKNSNNFKFD